MTAFFFLHRLVVHVLNIHLQTNIKGFVVLEDECGATAETLQPAVNGEQYDTRTPCLCPDC